MLTDKQEKFALARLAGLNKTQAYRSAYDCSTMSAKAVYVEASRLDANPNVALWIAERKKAALAQLEIGVADVLRELWQVATADPNELTYVRRTCCRHCHGFDFRYQWVDEEEYARACDDALRIKKAPPEFDGGDGFDARIDPHPDCPVCHGDGVPEVVVADTRKVTGPARRLLAGVKQTKDGIEIKFRDQDAALRDVGRHFGMFNDKLLTPGAGTQGAEIPDKAVIEQADASTLTRLYKDLMG